MTEAGIDAVVKAQPIKTLAPIVFSVVGNVTEARFAQRKNASSPMAVTPPGIVTEVMLVFS